MAARVDPSGLSASHEVDLPQEVAQPGVVLVIRLGRRRGDRIFTARVGGDVFHPPPDDAFLPRQGQAVGYADVGERFAPAIVYQGADFPAAKVEQDSDVGEVRVAVAVGDLRAVIRVVDAADLCGQRLVAVVMQVDQTPGRPPLRDHRIPRRAPRYHHLARIDPVDGERQGCRIVQVQ